MHLQNFQIAQGWEYLTYHLEFDLTLEMNTYGVSVKGRDLWRLGVWFSANPDGSGERFENEEQVSEWSKWF